MILLICTALQVPGLVEGGFSISSVIPYGLSLLTTLGGYFLGRKQQKNTFLQDMQKSIDLLSGENNRLLQELVNVNNELLNLRQENSRLLLGQQEMKRENASLVKDIAMLKRKLDDLKNITKTK